MSYALIKQNNDEIIYIYWMNRKDFLSSVAELGALFAGDRAGAAAASLPGVASFPATLPVLPPYLRAGDTVAITSPAGYISREGIAPAIALLKQWGFRVRIGRTIGSRFFGFGGRDEERAADMQVLLDDPSVKAILCARGGYGTIRIIDRLDFHRFQQHPKWIIGFSDVTVLHSHLNRQLGVASLHSKMCNSFPDNWDAAASLQKDTILSIYLALVGKKMRYAAVPSAFNRPGIAEGVLVGGNLKMIESLSGTASDLRTEGKILFVEDTGEYLYSLDRMFWNLKRTGKLVGLKGLVIGGFRIKPDDPGEEFGIALQDIVLDRVKDYSYPVCFDFPVGHQIDNFALKCGVAHRLEVSSASCTLQEIN